MKELMNYAGDITEEIEEAEVINSTKDEVIHTFTVTCGGAWTFFCC